MLAGILIIQVPQVQTAVAEKVTEVLSEKLDGEITVEKIHLRPFNTLVLKNLLILDKNPARSPVDSTLRQIDTFFRAEYIIAKFSLDGLTDKESIRIRSAYIGNAQMNLVLEDLVLNDGSIDNYDNLSRIFRIKEDRKSTRLNSSHDRQSRSLLLGSEEHTSELQSR